MSAIVTFELLRDKPVFVSWGHVKEFLCGTEGVTSTDETDRLWEGGHDNLKAGIALWKSDGKKK